MKTINLTAVICILVLVISCEKDNPTELKDLNNDYEEYCSFKINGTRRMVYESTSSEKEISIIQEKDTISIAYSIWFGGSYTINGSPCYDTEVNWMNFKFMKTLKISELEGELDTNNVSISYYPTKDETIDILTLSGNSFYYDNPNYYRHLENGMKVSLNTCVDSSSGVWNSFKTGDRLSINQSNSISSFEVESIEYVDSLSMFYLIAKFNILLYKQFDLDITETIRIEEGELRAFIIE